MAKKKEVFVGIPDTQDEPQNQDSIWGDIQEMTLSEKLFAMFTHVDYLQKDERNTQQNFEYVSAPATVAAIREHMKTFRIRLTCEIVDSKFHRKGTESMHVTELTTKYTWRNVDNPDDVEVVHWYSQGCDQHEKGVGKALTYGMKYFIWSQFQIATGKDDPDAFREKHDLGAPEIFMAQEECDAAQAQYQANAAAQGQAQGVPPAGATASPAGYPAASPDIGSSYPGQASNPDVEPIGTKIMRLMKETGMPVGDILTATQEIAKAYSEPIPASVKDASVRTKESLVQQLEAMSQAAVS